MVKILEKQDIYLSIDANPTREVAKADNLVVKRDTVDEVLEVIANSSDDMEEMPKDKRPFFFIVLILGAGVVFLVFKYKDKILYKD